MAVSPRIARLLAHEPVIDGHNDLPWEARALADYDWDLLDLATTICMGTLSIRYSERLITRFGGAMPSQYTASFSDVPESQRPHRDP